MDQLELLARSSLFSGDFERVNVPVADTELGPVPDQFKLIALEDTVPLPEPDNIVVPDRVIVNVPLAAPLTTVPVKLTTTPFPLVTLIVTLLPFTTPLEIESDPDEPPSEGVKLPLIEVPVTERFPVTGVLLVVCKDPAVHFASFIPT